MSTAGPAAPAATTTAPPASRGRLAEAWGRLRPRVRRDGADGVGDGGDDRLLRILRTDPVSRHTRILLWVLAGLTLVWEVGFFLLEPAVTDWAMSQPGLGAEVVVEGEDTLPRSGAGLAVRVAVGLFGVLVTLMFAWQPSLAVLAVLTGSAVLLTGLAGADHPHFTPVSLGGGWVLGALMAVRYSHRGFVWLAAAGLAGIVVVSELLADPAPTPEAFTWQGGAIALGVLSVLAAVPAYLVRRSRHRTRDRLAALAAQEERVRQAAEAERQRIAVELHDVVAHGLTVISMQAAMLPTLTDAERRRGAEEAIETAARQSLVDLRRMLTALRGTSRNVDTQDPDAVADLPGRLAELQARLRGAGYTVDGEFAGLDLLPESMRLTVLRIAQEATTNVLKHGPGTGPVSLCTRVDEDARVTVRVESPLAPPRPEVERGPGTRGPGAGPRRPFPASGFGLAGMAERVSLFGGTISAGARDGRWMVDAVLPTR
ncbi:sensor histidine kinase [Micrococcus sp.]|uniref:sensor histidine kinase n=1 Tax=Micrococcus sp. TaxID=1271 RepID=UPI0026DC48B5|nr:histidine kinase [Micrococcus sp.]MDO4239161.1 histidine kinase [Micrococcus sp.]